MKKIIFLFCLICIIYSALDQLFAQTEASVLVSFTPNYPATQPTEGSISVSFTPQYQAQPTEGQIAVSFTPNYSIISNSTDGIVGLESSTNAVTVSIVPVASSSGTFALSRVSTGFELISELYDLSPDGFVFSPPATLTFNFTDNPAEEAGYTLFRFDVGSGIWMAVSSQTLDTVNNKITGTLANVSFYAIFRKAPIYTASLMFGSLPSMNHPQGVAVDGAGNIYVADTNNDLIEKFSPTGSLIQTFGTVTQVIVTTSSENGGGSSSQNSGGQGEGNGSQIQGSSGFGNAGTNSKGKGNEGSNGNSNGQQNGPSQQGQVNQSSSSLIIKSSTITVTTNILSKPQGITLDRSGNLYVADTNNHRFVKFSSTGGPILVVGRTNPSGNPLTSLGTGFQPGSGGGEFNHPSDITLDSAGNIYVADQLNGRIQKFDLQGRYLQTILIKGGNSHPYGVALDSQGNLYVTDEISNSLFKLDPQGNLITQLPNHPISLNMPQDVALDAKGRIYVADRNNDRLVIYDKFARLLTTIGTSGNSLGQFNKPTGIFVDSIGNLYVADTNNSRIEKFLISQPTAPVSGTLALTATTTEIRSNSKILIKAAEGGEISHVKGHKLKVPPLALSKDLEITVMAVETPNPIEEKVKEEKRKELNLKGVSSEVEFGPEGTKFDKPVTIVLSYLPAGLDESKLKVHYWNPKSFGWESLESVVDKVNQTVSAQVDHFSLYQVLVPEPVSAPLAPVIDGTFRLGEVYAFPNPVTGGKLPTIHVEAGIADFVEIRIYDISGELVHETKIEQQPQVVNDKYAYEWTWDSSGIASGVYIYVVAAHKSGEQDIRVRKKLAVVR